MEGFSAKSGAVAFHNDLRFDLGRIFGDFSAGARRRAGAAAVAGAQRKIASLRDVWDLCPRAPFRFGKRGRDCSDRTASFQVECASWWGCEQVGSRGPNDGIVIFCRRPWGRCLSRLFAAARHGSSGAQAIRTWKDLTLSIAYSVAHWFLVLLVYLWVSHSFGGPLGRISMGDAMLVMAFTLVGSAVQLPGVGGGSQVASFLAYTAIFGVESEPAAAASIVMWLVTFAACSLAGVPLLIHEGFSLGKLREMAEHEKEAAGEGVARRGEPAP